MHGDAGSQKRWLIFGKYWRRDIGMITIDKENFSLEAERVLERNLKA
jgi:hypothetical protein